MTAETASANDVAVELELTEKEAKALSLAWGMIAAFGVDSPEIFALIWTRLNEEYKNELFSLTMKMMELV